MNNKQGYSAPFFTGSEYYGKASFKDNDGSLVSTNGHEIVNDGYKAKGLSNDVFFRYKEMNLGKTLMSRLVNRYYFRETSQKTVVTNNNKNYFAEAFLMTHLVRNIPLLSRIVTKPSVSYDEKQIRSQKCVALTDSCAEYLDVRKIPDKVILKFISHSKTELRGVLSKLKKRKHQLFVLGVGGSGSNLLYWMSEFARIADYDGLFKSIWVADNDKYEFDNLPRIPFVPTNGTLKINSIPTRLMNRLTPKAIYDDYYTSTFPTDHIIVGAPDMATRQRLQARGHNWFALTHKGRYISLRINPPVDVGFLNETYGLIALEKFYLNQMFAAFEFIKFLADVDDDLAKLLVTQDANNLVPHTPILDSFSYSSSSVLWDVRNDVRLNRKQFEFDLSDQRILSRGW